VSGKNRGGRPKSAEPRKPIQVKLPLPEVEAFDALVRKRSLAATGRPDALDRASVLRTMILAELKAEGIRIPKPKPATSAGG
jgi:hypothetical protein